MAKLATAKKVGIPVPPAIASDVTHLVAYFGTGDDYVPAYDQANRIELPIGDVPRQVKDGVEYFVFDTAQLPPADTEYKIAFTLADLNDKEEGDFSPIVSVPLDREAPVTLDQPIILDEG